MPTPATPTTLRAAALCVCAALLGACGGSPEAPAAATGSTVAAAQPAPAQPAPARPGVADGAVLDALADAGVPVDPRQTTLQLVRGICAQLSSGVADAEIAANLAPIAAYKASTTGGALGADEVANLLIATARDVHCPR